MKKKLIIILLTFIVILGAGLRLWQLGNVPPSPDWDEVALAYDAHSLFTTGKDEFGNFLPPVLRSFDDYKPALYAYLAIPSIEIFGVNTFAVRLPSAIMGILAIVVTYLLVKMLFKKESIALTAAFFLAISPWHIQFSRLAFETNVGVTMNLLMALFFVKGLKRPWMLLLAALFAGLNLSVYQSERVFTPLLVIALTIIFRKELFQIPKKYIFSAIIVGLLALAPTVLYITTHQDALLRLKGTSIFSNQTELLKKNVVRLNDDAANSDVLGKLIDNRRIVYVVSIAQGYIAHFDPNWLFMHGDINRHHAPGMGLLYLFVLPFILIGIYQLIFGPYDKKTKYFVFAWFLLAAIPASITTGVPHAVRTMNFVPIYDIFTAVGFVVVLQFLQKYKYTKNNTFGLRYIIYGIIVIAGLFNFTYFLNQYFVQQNYAYAYDWQYGYAKAIPEIVKIKNEYKHIIVSDRQPLDKSYMFFLFYLNYPPQKFQEIGKNSSGSFASDHHFDIYEFHVFDWYKEKIHDDTLFVGGPQDFPPNTVAKKTILYPNGEPAIMIVDPGDNK